VEPWRTAITNYDDTHIWIQGHDVTELMTTATFADVVFLLHKGRLPSAGERRIMDAILIASADHGPGSPSAAAARTVATGNRRAPEAAIAAGVLAIGDAHGGAGLACLELIIESIGEAPGTVDGIAAAARRAVAQARGEGRHLPGIGHRTHSVDPRTAVLFDLAQACGIPLNGVAFMRELEREAAEAIKPLPINIDGAIAAVLYDLGFAPALAKLFFIVGRVAGLSAQIVEEYTRERAMRITIPVTYDGPAPRPAAATGKGGS
jgi:citrate synthase